MILDGGTRKNLELTETLRDKNKFGSLLWAIDKTKTNMGARLLKNWVCQPLKRVEDIITRQDFVSELVERTDDRLNIGNLLEKIYDIQRLATRMSNSSANPKDFLSLKTSLMMLPDLLDATNVLEHNPLSEINQYRDEIAEYTALIDRTIAENAPVLIKE